MCFLHRDFKGEEIVLDEDSRYSMTATSMVDFPTLKSDQKFVTFPEDGLCRVHFTLKNNFNTKRR